MQNNDTSLSVYKTGLAGGWISLIGVLLSGPLGLILVLMTNPQPAWSGPAVYVQNYHPVQLFPFILGFLILIGYMMVIGAIYMNSSPAIKIYSLLAVMFTTIFAVLIFFNYMVQTTYIPALLRNYTPDKNAAIDIFSMTNPNGLPWVIEMWGYGFLGAATWLVYPYFGKQGLEKWTGIVYVTNGIVSILSAFATIFNLSWVQTSLGLVLYTIWNLLMVVLSIMTIMVFKRRIISGK